MTERLKATDAFAWSLWIPTAWVHTVRALAPRNRVYRHGLLEGFQIHGLWMVERLWPGIGHRPSGDIPWERVIGCFVWCPSPRPHRPPGPAWCVVYISPNRLAAEWRGWLPSQDLRRGRVQTVPLSIELIDLPEDSSHGC